MLQLGLGIVFEIVRCTAALLGLWALALGVGGIMRDAYPLFEQGLLSAVIASLLDVLSRLLRRYEL